MFFQIETTTVCNAACAFCVHKNMKRAKMHMQPDVFEKTVAEIARVSPIDGVTLTGLGETLLDPEIIERIKVIHYVLGRKTPVNIFTNGTNLLKYLDELLYLNVGIVLSLNNLDPEKRKSVMGINPFENGDLEEVLEKAGKYLTISGIVDWGLMEHGEKEIMKETLKERLFLHFVGNWAGKLFDLKFRPVNCCARPFNIVHVLVDGRVALCCFDSEGQVILGNNVIEALQGEKLAYYQEMLETGRRSQLELCRNCTTV